MPQKLELDAYKKAWADPMTAKEPVDEKAAEREDEIFKIRATKRGRQRGALRHALQDFATNREQHYEGGWEYNVVRPPPKLLPSPKSIRQDGENKPIRTYKQTNC